MGQEVRRLVEQVAMQTPLGQEAIRSHRSLKLLSEQLSHAGLNALRFDYFGTGDSGGDLLSARPGDWLEDIRLAAQELRERASVTRLVIVPDAVLGELGKSEAISDPT